MWPNYNYLKLKYRKADVSWLKKQIKYCKNIFEKRQLEKDLYLVQKARY